MENGKQPINPCVINNNIIEEYTGLTKREYFAAMAMQGMLSNGEIIRNIEKYDNKTWLQRECVEHADKLLKQLDNK